MCLVLSCCAVSSMNILLSRPLVETPELLCLSYYFVYSVCFGDWIYQPVVGGGVFLKFLKVSPGCLVVWGHFVSLASRGVR